MIILISSQRYIDDEIVAQKIINQDFTVQISPIFTVEDDQYIAIMDGHHSYHAAIEAGVEPEYYEQNVTENDNISLLENGEIDYFLESCYVDSDWYNIKTGVSIW